MAGLPSLASRSGFTHPLTEVFHPLPAADQPPSLRQPAKRRHRSTWAGAGKRVEENAMTVTNVGFNQILTDATINAGDTLNVLDGGTVVSTTVSGTLDVFSGGTAIDTILNGHEDVF